MVNNYHTTPRGTSSRRENNDQGNKVKEFSSEYLNALFAHKEHIRNAHLHGDEKEKKRRYQDLWDFITRGTGRLSINGKTWVATDTQKVGECEPSNN